MNIALLLSGGMGTRLKSDVPKQYIEVGGRPVVTYSMEQLLHHNRIDALFIVTAPEWQEEFIKWLGIYDTEQKFRGFSVPGENRQISILHGLEDIRKHAKASDTVLIHDAARPLLSKKLVSDCLDVLAEHEGAVPVLPMKDTIYASDDGKTVSELIDRNRVFAGQAPEAFRLGAYLEANRRLLPDKILEINGSAEPAVMAGLDVALFLGDENNFKLTTNADLERFRWIMTEH